MPLVALNIWNVIINKASNAEYKIYTNKNPKKRKKNVPLTKWVFVKGFSYIYFYIRHQMMYFKDSFLRCFFFFFLLLSFFRCCCCCNFSSSRFTKSFVIKLDFTFRLACILFFSSKWSIFLSILLFILSNIEMFTLFDIFCCCCCCYPVFILFLFISLFTFVSFQFSFFFSSSIWISLPRMTRKNHWKKVRRKPSAMLFLNAKA